MKSQVEKAEFFRSFHVKGDPLIVFNIWDAGSASAVVEAGAKAVATGSHSVAAANGYADGQELPLDCALGNIARIAASVDVPVSLDFEGGYTTDIGELARNIKLVIDAGAVGINFEDQIVGGEGLYSVEQQSERIAVVRSAADERGIPLFINARTDVFLKTYPAEHTREQLEEAVARADAYKEAGGSGLFGPGLRDAEMIRELCDRSPLPVNTMVLPDAPSNAELASLGVARISYGPGPYRQMIEWLLGAAEAVYSGSKT